MSSSNVIFKCHASILGNLYFLVTRWWTVRVGAFFFLSMVCESKSLFPGVWQQNDWLAVPDRGLSNKRVLLRTILPMDKISRLQGSWCLSTSSSESTLWKHCYMKARLFLVEAIRLCNIGVSLLLSVVGQKSRSQEHWVSWDYVRG